MDSALLSPLNDDQQRFVEVVGEVFRHEPGTWPIFDYVEGHFDQQRLDATEILNSFPKLSYFDYSAIWCPRPPRGRPGSESVVGLTIVGIHHCRALRQFPPSHAIPKIELVPAFLELLDVLARKRNDEKLSPKTPRKTEVEGDEVLELLRFRGFCFDRLPTRLLYDMIDKEPPLRGGGALHEGGAWSVVIPRLVNEFQGVASLDEYVVQLEALGPSPTPPTPSAPSPLGLVAAIDFLDTVWRLVPGHAARLFELHSAQRAAQLAFPAATADEFASRVSGLVEILRSVQVPQPPRSTRRSRPRDKPLSSLERHLLALLPGSQVRIRRAIAVLHSVIDIRDAGQHSAAGRKGAAALVELGVGYPPSDWAFSWSVVAAQTIEALDALREELATIAE